MKNLGLALLLFSALAVSACQKHQTKLELISAHPWKITGQLYNSTNTWPTVPSYIQDNIWTFNANTAYTVDEGATRANASDPTLISQGVWNFDATLRIIIFDNNPNNTQTILDLTEDILRVSALDSLGATVVTTFSKS